VLTSFYVLASRRELQNTSESTIGDLDGINSSLRRAIFDNRHRYDKAELVEVRHAALPCSILFVRGVLLVVCALV
jgi:hypothetical protein